MNGIEEGRETVELGGILGVSSSHGEGVSEGGILGPQAEVFQRRVARKELGVQLSAWETVNTRGLQRSHIQHRPNNDLLLVRKGHASRSLDISVLDSKRREGRGTVVGGSLRLCRFGWST